MHSPGPKVRVLAQGKARVVLYFILFILLRFGGTELGGRVDKKGLLSAGMCGLYLLANRCKAGSEPGSEDRVKGVAYMSSILIAQL